LRTIALEIDFLTDTTLTFQQPLKEISNSHVVVDILKQEEERNEKRFETKFSI
jgi:hypothetical protein